MDVKAKEEAAPSQAQANQILKLQAEIEQAEILLQRVTNKSKDMDASISESEGKKAQAEEDLRLVQQKVAATSRSSHTAPACNAKGDSMVECPASKTDIVSQTPSEVNTAAEMKRFQTQKTK